MEGSVEIAVRGGHGI